MKQTAVEFLEQQYSYIGKLTPFDFYQAKEMEKEQIIQAWELEGNEYVRNGKDYYNETFNK